MGAEGGLALRPDLQFEPDTGLGDAAADLQGRPGFGQAENGRLGLDADPHQAVGPDHRPEHEFPKDSEEQNKERQVADDRSRSGHGDAPKSDQRADDAADDADRGAPPELFE